MRILRGWGDEKSLLHGRVSTHLDSGTMSSDQTVDDALRDLLQVRDGAHDLSDELPLGAGGLGLDSIGMVQLLLQCEERFHVAIAGELLAGEPLTMGRLAAHIRSRLPE
jgi:acyl carrier protein